MNTLGLLAAILGVAASITQIAFIIRFAIDASAENLLSVAVCFLACAGIEMFNRSLEWLVKTPKSSKEQHEPQ